MVVLFRLLSIGLMVARQTMDNSADSQVPAGYFPVGAAER